MTEEGVGLIFKIDEAYREEKKIPQKYITIKIPKQAILKSPTLYKYFRSKPKEENYRINEKVKYKDPYKEIIQSVLFSNTKSLQKGFVNCVYLKNIDFLSDLNDVLNIKQLNSNIENFNQDDLFLQSNDYQNWKLVQESLHFLKDKNEDKSNLFAHIELLNKMKISNSLLSLRNRMDILTKIVNLRNDETFKKYISQDLDNEIQEFQKEINKISKYELNGNTKYGSIIDVIRYDDSNNLQDIVSSNDKFDIDQEYDFNFDFSNLLPKKANIFELTIYFNAINCYKYINANYIKPKVFPKDSKTLKNVPKFAFASGNGEMTRFCVQYKLIDPVDLSLYLNISIAYQNNHLCTWLIDNFQAKINRDSQNYAVISNNVAVLGDLIYEFGADLNFALFKAYDNDNIDMLKFLIKLKASNINYGMDGINILFFLYTSYSSCMHRRKY